MIKFKKVLSMAAIGALLTGALVSCGEDKTTTTASPESTTVINNADQEKATAAANLVLLTNNHSKVDANFTVPSTVTYDGVPYNLTWHSNNEELLTFDVQEGEAGLPTVITAVVHRPETTTDYSKVSFYATVTIGEASANSEEFDVRVKRVQTAQENYDSWVQGTAESYSFTGYVLKKVGYVESYKEANLIVWDEAGCGAYFVYNAYLDKEVYDSLEGGEYISVTGAVRSPYNGLLETKYGATATVDTTKTKLDLSTLNYTDISEGVVLNQSSLTKYQSSRVSLKNFKVVSVETFSKTSGKYGTTLQKVATLERDGVQIAVSLYEGMTPFADANTKTLDTELLKTLKVGSYVDVDGYLSWDSAPVIVVDNKNAVKASTAGTADMDKAYADLAAVASNFKSFYASNAEVTLPATGTNGAGFTYVVTGTNVSLENGKLTITAGETSAQGTVVVTATKGTAVFSKTFTITSQSLTDAEVAEKVAKDYKLDDISKPGSIVLGDGEDTYGSTYAWVLKDAQGVATLKDGKLIVVPTTEDKTVVLTLTVTMGEATYTQDVSVKVNKYTLTSYGTTELDVSKFTANSYYYVEGYITVEPNATYGNTYIAVTADGGEILQIYGLYDVEGKRYDKMGVTLPVGTKVVLYGQYVTGSNYKEIKNAVVLSYAIDYEAAAEADLAAAKKLFAESYAQAAEVTLPANVTAAVTAGTSAVVGTDGKITITPTDTQDSVTIVLTATEGTVTKTETITFTTKTVVVSGTVVSFESTKPSSNTTITTENQASALGLDDTIFTVLFAKGTGGTMAAYNRQIRLYAGNTLTITVAEGYVITGIKITYDTAWKNGGQVSVNGIAQSKVAAGVVDEVVIGSSSAEILVTGSTHVGIASIEVTYAPASN